MTRPVRRRIDGITTAEFDQLDDVTAGTVTASKAVVVDSNADIIGFNSIGATTITNTTLNGTDGVFGASGVQGSVEIYPATASKGKVNITTQDNAGNTTTSIIVAAQGAARSYTVPDFGVTGAEFSLIKRADVTLTSAQLLALNATPVEVIAAAGAGLGIIVLDLVVSHAGGTAYAGIASGEDLVLKYTDASGSVVTQSIETTGFLDQTGAQTRYVSQLEGNITPVANAAIVAHMLTGEITTGDFDLDLTIFYKVIPVVS